MPNPSPLERLHAGYRRLEEEAAPSLGDDDRRSLQYFHADVAELARSGDRVPTRDRVTSWIRNLHDVEHFINEHGRCPRENNRRTSHDTDPVEQRLVNWLRYQRRLALNSGHCSYQRDRLDLVPGYSESSLDQQWTDNFDAYRAFLQAHNTVPLLSSNDAGERHLAAWAAKQRLHHRRGRLPVDRVSTMETLEIWGWGSRTTR
jgi:hypothetical protein